MTESEYKKLLIETVKVEDYEDKTALIELLKICSLRFERTGTFTRHLWNHCEEYIQICIVPDKMIELRDLIKFRFLRSFYMQFFWI